MASFRAWQHIYANVERDQSPSKTAGFQTLFYSQEGLTQQDVTDIEERVFYVQGEYNPTKYIFFRLQSGKVGFGCVQTTAGKDSAGREGLYIAHTLVFEQETFQSGHLQAQDLFATDIFISSLDAAFTKGNKSNGDIDAISIAVPTSPRSDSNLPPTYLRTLVQLAINHKAISEKRAAVALIGTEQNIQKTLQATLTFVPPPLAPKCAFDTFFERGGNLSFTYVWAAGFKTQPRQPIYIKVDVDKQTIENAGSHGQPATAFGRWIDTLLENGQTTEPIAQKEEALKVSLFIDRKEKKADNVLNIDEQLIQAVVNANIKQCKQLIQKQVGASLPKVLVARIIDPFFESLSLKDTLKGIESGFEVQDLLSYLFERYQQNGFVAPSKEERKELAEKLESDPHQKLDWLLMIWGGGRWSNLIAKWRIKSGVEEMDDAGYEAFWQLAVPTKLVDPMHLLADGKEAQFTRLIIEQQLLPVDEVPDLVKALIKSQNTPSLQLLAPYLDQLNKKQIKKIKKRIQGIEDVSPVFTQTLELLDA